MSRNFVPPVIALVSIPVLAAPAAALTIVGTAGNDLLRGTPHSDTISAKDGSDLVYSRGGRDEVTGDAGDDWLFLGPGRDQGLGSSGADQLYGGRGGDALGGGADTDQLYGGPGDDSLWGANDPHSSVHHDLLVGGAGDDSLTDPERGPATYRGGSGRDRIGSLLGGRDRVWTGTGNDIVHVYNDHVRDLVDCGPGRDVVYFHAPPIDSTDEYRNCERFVPRP